MKRYSIWLIPVGRLADELNEAQARVNEILKGPDFPIHLTVTSGFETELSTFVEMCRACCQQAAPISLEIERYVIGERFYQSLFARVRGNPGLSGLRSHFYSRIGVEEPASYDPHFSLYYGMAKEADKERAVSGLLPIEGQFDSYSFAIGEHDQVTGAIIKAVGLRL